MNKAMNTSRENLRLENLEREISELKNIVKQMREINQKREMVTDGLIKIAKYLKDIDKENTK